MGQQEEALTCTFAHLLRQSERDIRLYQQQEAFWQTFTSKAKEILVSQQDYVLLCTLANLRTRSEKSCFIH